MPNMGEEVMDGIAIVGMAGRFPGARDIEEFWGNLVAGKESISFLEDKELLENGVASSDLKNANYVKAKGLLLEADCFDGAFFGYTPRDAELMDPQHRVLLETAYMALEDAGCNPEKFEGDIGVFASATQNTYLLRHLIQNTSLFNDRNYHQLAIANSNDFLATRLSYKFNLRGPAQTIQTGCSSSLVAIHYACQSLLNYECDAALAGGVSITVPLKSGYLYKQGSIGSPDGHCCPFDASAKGTLAGNGSAVVVLKRLRDAIAQNDRIYAVVKGSAINNDGNSKIGYTAPSALGQSKAIQAAHAMANIEPHTIQYVEAHGTGTRLGDPIEISGLSQAFGQSDRHQWCAIGSVKSNIGHLDAASGITGFIKTALSLYNQVIPPSINYTTPNPEISFETSPFFVNTQLRPWKRLKTPRRAGVSAFGIGGTNAHAVLEEAPKKMPAVIPQETWHLLPISAKTPAALTILRKKMLNHIQSHPQANLANMAYTLQTRRISYSQRAILVCKKEAARIHCDGWDKNLSQTILQQFSVTKQEAVNAWLGGEDSFPFMTYEDALEVVSLPAYPFDRAISWLPIESPVTSNPPEKTAQQNPISSSGILEQKLARILEGLLGVSQISLEDKFDSLGVDSLMRVEFVVSIEEEFKINVPFGIVTDRSSIEELAQYLYKKHKNLSLVEEANTVEQKPSLPALQLVEKLAIPIKEGDKNIPPLFCIHPAGGTISVFQELAARLNPSQSVIGIRALSTEDASDIGSVAERYKDIIQDIQPKGPYLLCGSSMGGTVAFDIAQRLEKEGHHIPILAMLDTPAPGVIFNVIPDSDKEILDYITSLSPEMAKELKKNSNAKSEAQKNFLDLWRCHRDAFMAYQGKPYNGSIIYFKAKELHYSQNSAFEHGWIPLAKDGIEIHEVSGNHLTMHFAPHVGRIADILDRKLRFIALQQLMLQAQTISQLQRYSYA